MRNRREASSKNWDRDRPDHTIGVTKGSRSSRKLVSRKKTRQQRVSRKANR